MTMAASLSRWSKTLQTWGNSRLSNLRQLARVYSYSTSADRILLVASVIASVCAGATLPLMNIIFARLVNTFNTPRSPSEQNPASFMSIINRYVLYIVYLFVGRVLLAYIAIFGFRNTSIRISAAIRLHYLQALFQLPISTLDSIPSGQTAAIITITANALQLGISERLSSLIQAIAVILVSLIIGCIYSWTLTLATTSGVISIMVWYALFTPMIVKKYAVVQESEREAASIVSEALLSIRMVAACGAEEKMAVKYDGSVMKASSESKAMSPLLALQHSPVFFTIFASFALCFWYAVRLYTTFQFSSVEALVVVLMSIMTMIAHLSAISVPLTAASNALSAAGILFSIIDAPKPAIHGLDDFDLSQGDINITSVNFAYPSRHDIKILRDFHLTIPAGKTTALVGPSGSGKSTVIALILRWYELGGHDPVANFLRNGKITIGAANISDIDIHYWRGQIGLVQQDPFLFHDTIFRNVEYGLVGTRYENASDEVKRALVEQACKDAYADEFIRHLPDGYGTSVGDSGLQLSGGQRQRLAIARAIVRQPTLLIFDEATSALDVASERIVQAALRKAAQGRTSIVIAHRLSTVRSADHIAVIAHGQVIERGSHDQLLGKIGGAYWKLVNAQQLVSSIPQPSGVWPKSYNRRASQLLEKDSQETLVDAEDPCSSKKEENTGSNQQHVTESSSAEKHRVRRTRSTEASGSDILGSFTMLLSEQRDHWSMYTIMILAAAGAGSTSSIQAYLFARLISGFAYWGERLIASTSFLCLMLLVVAISVGLSYFTLGWLANNVSTTTIARYRKEYFRNTINKSISFFDEPDHAVGLLTANIAGDPSQLQQLLGMNMAMVMISIFNVTGCTAIALTFNWKFGLVVVVSSLPIILAGGWYRVRHEVRFEARNNKIFADSARFATEAISGIRTVVSLTLEREICHRYDRMLKDHIGKSRKESRTSCVVFALSDSMVLLCMAFALWYGGTLLATQSISSFDFLVAYLAVIQGSLAAGQWLSFGPTYIAQVSTAASRIKAMRSSNTDAERTLARTYTTRHRWRLPQIWKGADIELRDVWFQYPTRNVPVLRGCSIKIYHGQFAAIVGSSGAGKTSIISLLERFYEPQRGCILYNGEDIKSIPRGVARKRMGLVAQEASIFGGTIRENILLGIEGDINDEAIHKAGRDAGIHDFVASLPDGYHTEVGKAGVSLSGGQRQRLSIARALIRDPSVLLLDEATSSLDSTTEKEVQAVFEESSKGRTMIVVAHRLATVQNADIIFVMHEGRVVESGDHASLLAKRGMYWKMCEAQALGAS